MPAEILKTIKNNIKKFYKRKTKSKVSHPMYCIAGAEAYCLRSSGQ